MTGYLHLCRNPKLKGDTNEDIIDLIIDQKKSIDDCNNSIKRYLKIFDDKEDAEK